MKKKITQLATSWLPAAEAILNSKTAASVNYRTNEPADTPDAIYEPEDSPVHDQDHGVVLLDAFTASMLVNVANVLNAENREKFVHLPIVSAVNVGWKLVK